MIPDKRELLVYETPSGKAPFLKWRDRLKDLKGRSIIRAKLDRLELYGPVGHYEPVGEGVYEIKVHHGPGYRVYFGEEQNRVLVILCGGDKSSQSKDVLKAKQYWKDYKERT